MTTHGDCCCSEREKTRIQRTHVKSKIHQRNHFKIGIIYLFVYLFALCFKNNFSIVWPSVTLQLFEMILLFVKFVIYFLLKLLPDFSIMSIMFKLLIDFTIMCIMCTQCEQAKGNVLYEGYRPINFLCPVSYAPQCTGLPGTRGVYPLLGHDLPVLLSSVPRFDPQVSPSPTPPVENSKRSDAQA